MGTHPIFESDFDCLTEHNESFIVSITKIIAPSETILG